MKSCSGALPGFLAVLVPLLAGGVAADSPPQHADLRDTREEMLEAIRAEPFDEPVHIDSTEGDDVVRGEIHAVVEHPYERLLDVVGDLSAWCGIILLHFNVKACIHDESSEPAVVTLYTGRMYYREPGEVASHDFAFRVMDKGRERLVARIEAEKGPFYTYDYEIEVEAVPLEENASLVRVSFAVRYGMLARWAQRAYYASVGRDKIGFSAAGEDVDGQRQYIGGLRGMMERNTVRLYLALQAFLEYPGDENWKKRFNRWFDLTERYPEQLREMDREAYLENKRKELANQRRLQDELDQR